jgi:IS30 family transposase
MATQLTMEEREVIGQMEYAGQSQASIARRLGRPASTVSRELKRNGSAEGYSAVAAQRQAQERRRQRPLVRKMDRPEVNEEVRQGLARCWSPDQVAGRIRRDHPNDPSRCVSHQTVYDWLKRDANREHWEGFLRRGGKRRPKNDRRGKLKGTVSVADRLEVVDERRRFGDWEGDTMVGAKHRGALVTHVERKSGYLLVGRIDQKKSRHVNRATRRLFAGLPQGLRRTLTLDNGKEFAGHDELATQNGIKVYFADPYAAWQRGTNENTNGLLRQYFPKGTDFTQVSHHELKQIAQEVNQRPRKRLGYRTPYEVLRQHFPVAFES